MHIIDPYALIRLTVHDVPAKQARAGAKQGWFRGEVSNHELSRRHFVRIDFPTNEHAIKDLYDEVDTDRVQDRGCEAKHRGGRVDRSTENAIGCVPVIGSIEKTKIKE